MPSGDGLFPAIYALPPLAATDPFDYLNQRVEKIYHDTQAPYLDLLPAFHTIRDPRSLVVSLWDAHPNAKANHLAALAIYDRFLPVWAH